MSPSPVALTSHTHEEVHPPPVRVSANFDPSVWRHHFLSFADDASMDAAAALGKSMKHEHAELKEKVRNMLLVALHDNENNLEKLDLIDAIQRLGVHYHFEDEMSELLSHIYQLHMENEDLSDNNNDNLHYVALKFRLLRQHGYNISCVLFDKFKDEQGGGFKESLTGDAKGLLSLYEAAHFSVHGEDILDQAIVFCTTHLEAMLLQHQLHLTSSKSASNSSLATHLIKQVKHALNCPMLKEPERLMSRHFLVFYKARESHDSRLLRFAKMDFHLVQLVHQKDIATLTKWWKDSDYANKLPFTRDRIVESFFWALGIYWKPQYSLAICTIAKLISILTIIDDIFDAHGTLDELEIFYQASQRWDMACIDEFPEEYMKVAYKALLDFFQGIEDAALKEQRPSYAPYAIEQMKIIIWAYWKEAKWCHQDDYIPTTEEYLSVSLLDACQTLFAVTGFSCLSDPYVPEDVIQWTVSNPPIIQAANYIGRVMGDIATHKFEQMRKHVPSVVECYMKEHGETEEETIGVMRAEIRKRWKDVNESCVNPTAIPKAYMHQVRSLVPILDFIYKGRDLFTDAEAMKDTVSFLLTESVWDS